MLIINGYKLKCQFVLFHYVRQRLVIVIEGYHFRETEGTLHTLSHMAYNSHYDACHLKLLNTNDTIGPVLEVVHSLYLAVWLTSNTAGDVSDTLSCSVNVKGLVELCRACRIAMYDYKYQLPLAFTVREQFTAVV